MIALLADIHGNREAMTACLADGERKAADRYVFLGDLVGYGADPGWVTDRAMDYVMRGAIAILGNHDAAAVGQKVAMNETAAAAIAWTRSQLDAAQRNFLEKLPLSVRHLITGARASSKPRRFIGSVSAKIVAEAPCSVTVVRA